MIRYHVLENLSPIKSPSVIQNHTDDFLFHVRVCSNYGLYSFKSNECLINYLYQENNLKTSDLSPLTIISSSYLLSRQNDNSHRIQTKRVFQHPLDKGHRHKLYQPSQSDLPNYHPRQRAAHPLKWRHRMLTDFKAKLHY